MSLVSKNKSNNCYLSSTFINDFNKKNKDKTISIETNSSEIAEIISKKLLEKIQEKISK